MERVSVILRAVEFGAAAGLGYVLGSDASSWWVVAPIAAALAAFTYDFQRSVSVKHAQLERALRDAYNYMSLDPNQDIRLTVDQPRRFPRRGFRQICSYVPHGGGRGRLHPNDKGILWKANEAKSERTERFASDVEYRRKMVDVYNYTAAEMNDRTTDRRSYVCLPVIEGDDVLCLVYLDSSDPVALPPDGSIDRSKMLTQLVALMRAALS